MKRTFKEKDQREKTQEADCFTHIPCTSLRGTATHYIPTVFRNRNEKSAGRYVTTFDLICNLLGLAATRGRFSPTSFLPIRGD